MLIFFKIFFWGGGGGRGGRGGGPREARPPPPQKKKNLILETSEIAFQGLYRPKISADRFVAEKYISAMELVHVDWQF